MKTNIKKIMVLGLLTFALMGCGKKVNNIEPDKESDASMFVCIERTMTWTIVYHKETKVMYAVSDYGYGSGVFTLLVDRDGNPMIWEGE
jgi:hypothetical protein